MSGFAAANQHLASKGVPSSKFEDKGDSHTGVLIDADVQPQTDPQGAVKMRKDGVTPVMQLVLTWKTEERDPKNPADKGERKLYCSWRLESEIKRAVRASGAEGMEEGGKLTVTFVREEKIEGVLGKAKIYEAEYEAPTRKLGVPLDDEADDEAPAPIPADKAALIDQLWAQEQPVSLIAQVTGLSSAQIEKHLGMI